jgi:fatty acid desaturase
MQVEFELTIIVIAAFVFLIGYLTSNDLMQRIVLGIISVVSWIVLALAFVASRPTFPYFSFLFVGIALVLATNMVHEALSAMHEKNAKMEID